MSIIKAIKIFFLERKLAKLVGHEKYFGKKVKLWETIYLSNTKFGGYENPSNMKIYGRIQFYKDACTRWRLAAELCRIKLRKMGVVVII